LIFIIAAELKKPENDLFRVCPDGTFFPVVCSPIALRRILNTDPSFDEKYIFKYFPD
jgi:hypothetical protein